MIKTGADWIYTFSKPSVAAIYHVSVNCDQIRKIQIDVLEWAKEEVRRWTQDSKTAIKLMDKIQAEINHILEDKPGSKIYR
jgi:hypothetical protein